MVGTKSADLSAEDVSIDELEWGTITKESITDNGIKKVKVTFKPTEGSTITEDVITIKIPIHVANLTKTFTLAKLTGSKDYDLMVTPSYYHATYADDKQTVVGLSPDKEIQIKITEKDVSSLESQTSYISKLPDGYKLSCAVDGEPADLTLIQRDEIVASLDLASYCNGKYDNVRKITISLFNEKNTLVDWSEVAVLKDGAKGDKGEDGASSYYIDVENDFD
jgi:hypothetical protein